MRKSIRIILSFLLSLILVVGAVPFMSITVFAANAGKEASLIKAVNAGGDVKLTKDITLSDVLRIPTGITVTLDLNGKTLNRGLTDCRDLGSVIRVEPGATLTVKDSSNKNSGVITGGASWNGGGICNHGTLTIKGGTISGNKALHERYGGGGGIYNGSYNGSKATLTLEGGVIEYNKARDGGGIYNSDGTVIIHKGSYSVTVLSQLKTYETNVTIKNNEAYATSGGASSGSGICSFRDISIQDAPYISGNKDNKDIYLLTGKVLKLTGKLKKTALIGIATEDYDNIITSGYFTYQTEDPNEFFKPTDKSGVVRMSNTKENGGEVMIKYSGKTLLEIYKSANRSQRKASELLIRQEFDNPTQAFMNLIVKYMSSAVIGYRVELTLGSDYKNDGQITVPSNAYLVVDLNGHYICRTRNGKMIDNGGVFLVKEGGTLTINDSNPNVKSGWGNIKGGIIMGGANSNGGGGITIERTASLYMNGGTIYDCRSDDHGGGICANNGAKIVVLKNCRIHYCHAVNSKDDCSGGGIYARNVARLELENVDVTTCYSEDSGGGVYYYGGNNGIFIMSACYFDNNVCKDDGGAVYFSSSEGGYFDKCTFSSNTAHDDGGAIYTEKNILRVADVKKDEPVMIRECTMRNNKTDDEGSAVFVDREDVVFVTNTITGNNAGDKGAVYVSHNAGRYGYDISVKGLMIVVNNKSGTANRANIVLENYGATHNYIYCAGLYEGSSIWFSTLDSGKVKVLRHVDSYQLRYFHAEVGNLSFEGEITKEATMVTASLFGGGSWIAIISLFGTAVVVAVVVIIYKKKKKEGAVNNENKE